MKSKIRILFVCTGNVFRSLSAEWCLKEHLKKNNINNIIVHSAGTLAEKEHIHPTVLSALKAHGIFVNNHIQTKLTKEIIEKNDVIIAMAGYHQDFIKKNFGISVPLFNKIALGKSSSVNDINDVLPSDASSKDVDNFIIKTINHIHNSIPKLVKCLNSE
ncbi:hypothetical protein HYV79_04320 [Candidatus Woesearchaeota archaeon]|nr:hypothetical protein [Candidatus Woesearchaeota archaeon]